MPFSFRQSMFARFACLLTGVILLLGSGLTASAQDALPLPTPLKPMHTLYWSPPAVTYGADEIDFLINIIFGLTAFVFFAVNTMFIYYMVKYRRKPGVKAYYSHGNNTLEILWTTTPTIVFLSLAIYGNNLWKNLFSQAPENSIPIEIVGFQFAWDIRYPGADGVLGRADDERVTPDNKLGIDWEDPAAKDDFTSTELVIPVGRPVHLYLRSRDVIHSFYVPVFRLYQDTLPGRTIDWVWFECHTAGEFEIACSQLCGQGHYNMKARIRVVPLEEYEAWYAEKVKQTAEAQEKASSGVAQAQP